MPIKLCRKLTVAQRVQVPNNHILTPNLYYNYYYPNPKYLIIGYMDPVGSLFKSRDVWVRQPQDAFIAFRTLPYRVQGLGLGFRGF